MVPPALYQQSPSPSFSTKRQTPEDGWVAHRLSHGAWAIANPPMLPCSISTPLSAVTQYPLDPVFRVSQLRLAGGGEGGGVGGLEGVSTFGGGSGGSEGGNGLRGLGGGGDVGGKKESEKSNVSSERVSSERYEVRRRPDDEAP